MAPRADIATLNGWQPKLVGDLLGSRIAMERLERRKMRRPHPLLDFRLMTLRALIGPDDFRRIVYRRTDGPFIRACRADKKQRQNGRKGTANLTQRRKGAEWLPNVFQSQRHVSPVPHCSLASLCDFASS
jgi:hypothetical protein